MARTVHATDLVRTVKRDGVWWEFSVFYDAFPNIDYGSIEWVARRFEHGKGFVTVHRIFFHAK